jgi:opacity protein-like surface antigen
MARLTLLIVLLLSLMALPAFAQDDDGDDGDEYDPDYARTGAYASLQVKAAFTTSDWYSLLDGGMSWQPDLGMDIRLGWRETPLWSIEAEFEWIPNHNGIEYGSWLLGANGKFYALFMEDRLQPYFIIGANGLFANQPQSRGLKVDWGFRNGLGIDYYLTGNWAINAETTFVWGVGSVWKYYFLTAGVGVQYRF